VHEEEKTSVPLQMPKALLKMKVLNHECCTRDEEMKSRALGVLLSL
jgi:hypothetical protein